MEPFEWLLLGAGLAIGSLFGAKSKGVMKTAAKGYLTVEERTRNWSANMREDFRDALEEARFEREQAELEAELNGQTTEVEIMEVIVAPPMPQTQPRTRARRSTVAATADAAPAKPKGAKRGPRRNAANAATPASEATGENA